MACQSAVGTMGCVRNSIEMPFINWIQRHHFIIILLLVTFVVFQGHANYVLNHFYTHGAFLYDSGWLADLVYQPDLLLTNPTVLGDFYSDKSFFTIHLTPFFLLAGWLSHFFSSRIEFYAVFQATIYALGFFATGLWMAKSYWQLGSIKATKKNLVLAILIWAIFILTPFNGIALAAASFPHYEFLITAFILLFLWQLHSLLSDKNRTRASLTIGHILCFITWLLLVGVREDGGFQLGGLLILLCLVCLGKKIKFAKWRLVAKYAILSVIVPVMLIIWQKSNFTGDDALGRVYLGDPPFGHITLNLLVERFDYLFTYRLYIVVPWLLMAGICLWTLNPWLTVGLLAYTPWFIVSVLAISEPTARFHSYYGFPFYIMQVWPLVYFHFENIFEKNNKIINNKIIITSLIITASSFIGFIKSEPVLFRFLIENASSKVIYDKSAYLELSKIIVNNELPVGNYQIDQHIASIEPDHFRQNQLLSSEYPLKPTTSYILAYENTLRSENDLEIPSNGFFRRFKLLGTPIYLVDNGSTTEFKGLSDKLIEVPIWENMTITKPATIEEGTLKILPTQPEGWVFFGPWWKLKSGSYVWRIKISHNKTDNQSYELHFDCTDVNLGTFSRLKVSDLSPRNAEGYTEIELPIELKQDANSVELRLYLTGKVNAEIVENTFIKRK